MPEPVPRRIVVTTPDGQSHCTEDGALVQVQIMLLDAVAKAARIGKPVEVSYVVDFKEAKP